VCHKRKLRLKLRLRPLELADASMTYVKWLADSDVNRFLEVRHSPPSLDALRAWIADGNADPSQRLFGVVSASNSLVGTATINQISPMHGTFGAGWMIGEKSHWGGTSAIQVMFQLFDVAFFDLSLRKFFGAVYANHAQARLSNRFLGIHEEARLRDSVVFEGALVDTLVVTMTKENWTLARLEVLSKLKRQETGSQLHE